MAASSTTLHESPEKLGPDTIDRHRAIVSLMEELEAADWSDQRSKAAQDEELRSILVHNRDEEKEHAAMLLEWLRRHDVMLADHLKTYLFRDGPIHESKEAPTGTKVESIAARSLGIGSLRKREPA
jgi:uncharacterized protein